MPELGFAITVLETLRGESLDLTTVGSTALQATTEVPLRRRHTCKGMLQNNEEKSADAEIRAI